MSEKTNSQLGDLMEHDASKFNEVMSSIKLEHSFQGGKMYPGTIRISLEHVYFCTRETFPKMAAWFSDKYGFKKTGGPGKSAYTLYCDPTQFWSNYEKLHPGGVECLKNEYSKWYKRQQNKYLLYNPSPGNEPGPGTSGSANVAISSRTRSSVKRNKRLKNKNLTISDMQTLLNKNEHEKRALEKSVEALEAENRENKRRLLNVENSLAQGMTQVNSFMQATNNRFDFIQSSMKSLVSSACKSHDRFMLEMNDASSNDSMRRIEHVHANPLMQAENSDRTSNLVPEATSNFVDQCDKDVPAMTPMSEKEAEDLVLLDGFDWDGIFTQSP